MDMKYYMVVAKCGHVGRGKCIFITFATMAKSAKEAAERARGFKRVKHGHKDAIRSVREIGFEEFVAIRAENDADPYLHCKNVQEQRCIEGFEARISEDKREVREARRTDKALRRRRLALAELEARAAMRTYVTIGECA